MKEISDVSRKLTYQFWEGSEKADKFLFYKKGCEIKKPQNIFILQLLSVPEGGLEPPRKYIH